MVQMPRLEWNSGRYHARAAATLALDQALANQRGQRVPDGVSAQAQGGCKLELAWKSSPRWCATRLDELTQRLLNLDMQRAGGVTLQRSGNPIGVATIFSHLTPPCNCPYIRTRSQVAVKQRTMVGTRWGEPTLLATIAGMVPPRLRQFAGWFTLGVLAFGIEVGLLGLLRQGLECPLWLASAIAAEVVLLGRFLSTDRLVFGYAHPSLVRCWRFHAAAAGSFAVSWLVLNSSAALLDVHYAVAAFLGSVAAFVWSGLTNFLWVWRRAAG
jgi:putative flippase GtrA